ncbi:glycosyltransferase family 2 protein [Secundilactobacillus mixtipabuli]|uniref:Glycosyl transferase n=1 Tax=Secundilactobacillus mixtipabuli TaxID=1435342 RepID=A0A1Z5IBL4_9LACO|nr:glycosyltransferase family 2 protein [Secundilactobacillus mixtipabuli]GAW99216.1 glycosyl transferase [Secundilactobacillus mixtipabuli]
MGKILTITIPSYNVEEFLNPLLKSFVSLHLENDLEILVVNDGSKDDTLKIAKEFAIQFPNLIRVIDKVNAGHGSTINVGILKATGQYFKLLDADDWLEAEALKKMISFLKKESVDMVVSPYLEFNDKTKRQSIVYPFKPNNLRESVDYAYGHGIYKVPPMHSIIYKTSILKENFLDIKVDENSFYVDVEYILYPIKFIKTIKYTCSPLYVYRINREGQSTSVDKFIKNKAQHKQVLVNINEHMSSMGMNNSIVCSRISEMIAAHFKIILLQKIRKSTYQELKNFKREIDWNFNYKIEDMNEPIQFLIKSHFLIFPVLHFLALWKAKLGEW